MSRKPVIEGKTRNTRVFIVELKVEMPDTPSLLTFGSKKAIFEYFGNDALRLSYSTACNIHFDEGYENSVCVIRETRLLSINSAEIIDRRKREGREIIPSRNLKGAMIMRNKQLSEKQDREEGQ